MTIRKLTDQERRVVHECLMAALNGPFFPDWEFQTLFGIDREVFAKVVEAWPAFDESDDEVQLAINNSMGNLIGYPHGAEKKWSEFISVPPEEVRRILKQWRE